MKVKELESHIEELYADLDHRITELEELFKSIVSSIYTKKEIDKLGLKCKEVDDKQWNQINKIRKELSEHYQPTRQGFTPDDYHRYRGN